MGAFRQKSGMHPFFLSEPYETVSLRKLLIAELYVKDS